MKKVNSKYKEFFMAVVIFLIYFIWPYFLSKCFNILGLDVNGIIALTLRLILNFLLLGIIIFILRNELYKDISNFNKNIKKMLKKGLMIFVIGLSVYFLANILITTLLPNINQYDDEGLYNIFKQVPVLLIISMLFYYPIIEEIVFKKTFKNLISNKFIFIIITGMINPIFQIAFSYNSITPEVIIYIVPNIILGMTFSWIYYENNNLTSAIIYRILYNLLPTLLALPTLIGSLLINS